MITKRTVANFLRSTARVLEEDGWCQGQFHSYDNDTGKHSHCLIGAMGVAECRGGFPARIEWAALEAGKKNGLQLSVSWNDHPRRTKEQVTQRLRKLAYKLDHGGKL